MASLLWCFPHTQHKRKPWKKIEDEAAHLDDRPSWANPSDNSLMMQAFEWHVPDDKAHWRRLRRVLQTLKDIGVDRIWIPPGCKAMNPSGNGYDIYDLYDLGEFDQKGSRGTKWGSKEELQCLIRHARDIGVEVYWDAVLNHKAGADYTERFEVVEVDPKQRNKSVHPPEKIDGWTGFDFPGRGSLHSSLKYHWNHFSGVDWDQSREKQAVYRILGPNKGWATDVSDENGNYDYLMFADLDYSNPEVREDVLRWGKWIGKELSIGGMRLDAAKHYSMGFQKEFIDYMRQAFGPTYFFMGEYWSGETKLLVRYLDQMGYRLSVFDVPLLERFSNFSQRRGADLRWILDDTLVQSKPQHAVTFVTNHDTQPGQSLENPVAPFFKPLAYALILLQNRGQPCVFYGDLYGIRQDVKHPMTPSCGGKLPVLCRARRLYAYGEQQDYFDHPNCIGFVRYGNLRHPSGLACVMSNAAASKKRMFVGRKHARERWTDILGWHTKTVTIDKKGYGVFPVAGFSVSVWVDSTAEGRDSLDDYFDYDIYKN